MEATAFIPLHLAEGCRGPSRPSLCALSSLPSRHVSTLTKMPTVKGLPILVRLVETETGVTFLLQQGLWDLAGLALVKLRGKG